MAESQQTAVRKPARELQFYKCEYCRRDKKKCLPTDRQYPQKCERCLEKGFPCSQPLRSDHSKRRDPTPAAPSPVVTLAQPTSAARGCNLAQTTVGPGLTGQDPESSSPDAEQAENLHSTIEECSLTRSLTSTSPAPVANDLKRSAHTIRSARMRKRRDTRNTSDDRGGTGDQVASSDEPAVPLPLACPFYKFDPVNHFRCFRKYELRRYSDVKQHLLRCHTLGTFYCSNCWMAFSHHREEEWIAHVQQMGCQNKPLPENLLPGEVVALNDLRDSGVGTDDQKWYKMWDLLFAEHPRPASPFMQTGFSEVLSLLEVSMASLQARLPSLLDSAGITLDQAATESLAAQIHGIYTNGTQTTTRRRLQYRRIDAAGANTQSLTEGHRTLNTDVAQHIRPAQTQYQQF